MHQRTTVLDNGAGPNLIRKESLPSTWTNNNRAVKYPGLTVAEKSSVIVDGVILLHVRLSELWAKLSFGILTRLAVSLLSGNSFIDRFSKEYTHRSARSYRFIHTPSQSSKVWIKKTKIQHLTSRVPLMVEGRGGNILSGSRKQFTSTQDCKL